MPRFALNTLPLLLLAVTVRAQGDDAAAPRMTFKNNVIPGLCTRHTLDRVITRATPQKKFVERLVYRRTAEWLRLNMERTAAGEARFYQQIEDGEPRVVRLLHDESEIENPPDARQFNLPPGRTRLLSGVVTRDAAAALAPNSDAVEHVVLRALLGFAHWPKEGLAAGGRWTRQADSEEFSGRQTFEFVDLGEMQGRPTAQVTVYIEGEFVGPLRHDWRFDKAQAVLYWSRPDRVLISMEARALYQRLRDHRREDYELRMVVSLKEEKSLTSDEQSAMRAQLNAFAQALKRLEAGQVRELKEEILKFQRDWPQSPWLPAAEALQSQLVAPPPDEKSMSTESLLETLGRHLVQREAARDQGAFDLMDAAEAQLRRLAGRYRYKLKKLIKQEDRKTRALAAFASAFGEKDEDLQRTLLAARDAESAVRGAALLGLSARRYPQLDGPLLLLLLGDAKPTVRARACLAAGACLRPWHYAWSNVRDRLNDLMIHDPSDRVRREAIRAVAAAGSVDDVELLKKALTYEAAGANRMELNRAIETLTPDQ